MRIIGFMGVLSAMLLLTACSGSSGGGSSEEGTPDSKTPDVDIVEVLPACGDQIQLTFPSAYSATLASSITLRGTSDCSTITDIQVAGVSVTSADDFANWHVVVPLNTGLNTLEASVFEDTASQAVALAKIEQNELLYSPTDMQLTADEEILYVMDTSRRHLLKVDMASGARTVLSGVGMPDDQFLFGNAAGMALNETDNVLYVASRHIVGVTSGNIGIIAVDLDDGARTLISNPDAPANGSELVSGSDDLVFDADQQRLYLSNNGVLYWVELDPAQVVGKISILSDATTPDANNLFSSGANMSLALDTVNIRLIVSDAGNQQVLAVNVDIDNGVLGERSIVLATGSDLNNVSGISLLDSDNVYLTDYRSDNTGDIRVHKLVLSSGELTQVIDTGLISSQRPLTSQHYPLYVPSTQSFLLSVAQAKSVANINLTDGTYDLLLSNTNPSLTGRIELLDGISSNALDKQNQVLYTVKDYGNVLSLNLTTGERHEFASSAETSSNFEIESLGFDEQLNSLIMSYDQRDSISGITTGHVAALPIYSDAWNMITSSAMDTSSEFREPWDWVRFSASHGIVVDDTTSPSRYYQTDIETGRRTELAIDLTAVPASLQVEDMEISSDKSTLYVADDSPNSGLYKIDLNTNVASIITDATIPDDGNDARLYDPEALAVSSDGLHLYVGDDSLDALVKVNIATGSREVLISDNHPSSNSWAERIQGIAVDSDKQVLYTTCNNADVVLMMDEVSNEWVLIAE